MSRFDNMKPRQVEAYIRERIREIFGDEVENRSTVTASHGYYHISVELENERLIAFDNFRKKDLPSVVKALKGMV